MLDVRRGRKTSTRSWQFGSFRLDAVPYGRVSVPARAVYYRFARRHEATEEGSEMPRYGRDWRSLRNCLENQGLRGR